MTGSAAFLLEDANTLHMTAGLNNKNDSTDTCYNITDQQYLK